MLLSQRTLFDEYGDITIEEAHSPFGGTYPKKVGEFWTSKQRQMHSLHYVVSYRASFKPELPDYFIRRFSKRGDIVFDPFNGRGTTVLQANILGRIGWGNDINPLSEALSYPKTHPVEVCEIEERLEELNLAKPADLSEFERFSMFYHEKTYNELINLRDFLSHNRTDVDRFIQLIAISRLHGHSDGFFSVYSFPQISVRREAQERINQKRNQTPEYRPIIPRIIKKARQALSSGLIQEIRETAKYNLLTTEDVRNMNSIPSEQAQLIVTSPPFLDKADYLTDNWLELWFIDVNIEDLRGKIIQTPRLKEWKAFMKDAIAEMARVLRSGGFCVIEVGEVCDDDGRIINLDEVIVEVTYELLKENRCHLIPQEILINLQRFTKLANCFNVTNNEKGTNTNRLVVLRKP